MFPYSMSGRILAAAASVFAVSLACPDTLRAEDDWGSWTGLGVEKKIDERWRLLWSGQMRTRDDFSDTHYWETRQGAAYKAHDHLDLAAHYVHAEDQNTAGRWVPENKLELQPTIKWRWGSLNLSDRSRFEYRSVDDKEKWRYRNLIKLSHPARPGGWECAPYISEEVFYDFKKDELNQNRFSVGLTRKLSAHAALDLYYMVKSDRSGEDWSETHILGSQLALNF